MAEGLSMAATCSNPDCEYPDTPCFRRSEFQDPEQQCPDLAKGRGGLVSPSQTTATPVASRPETGRALGAVTSRFWTGHALGSAEVFSLLTDNPPRLVAVCGREDAGKTCLLTSQWMQIAQGRAPGVRFCGSRTLRGWDQLADAAWEWTGDPGQRIVPRTSLGSHREPGLLHFAFKKRWEGDSRHVLPEVQELVLTDFPGEWFAHWTLQAEMAAEMPWVRRVDVFWVVVDAPRLLESPRALRDARNLLQKVLFEARDGRPVALVLTQTDRVESPPLEDGTTPVRWPSRLAVAVEQLTGLLRAHTGENGFFPVSAFPGRAGEVSPKEVLTPLLFAMQASRPRAELEPALPDSDRMFHYFRESLT